MSTTENDIGEAGVAGGRKVSRSCQPVVPNPLAKLTPNLFRVISQTCSHFLVGGARVRPETERFSDPSRWHPSKLLGHAH